MREIELKILLDDEQESALRRSGVLMDQSVDGPRTQTLVSIYYDTADDALRRAGIALRLRRKGRAWVQTVKKSTVPISGGLSQPIEDEISVRGQNFALNRIGDDDLREEVIGLARAGMTPVSQTHFRRTTYILQGQNSSRIELAIDRGRVGGDVESAPFCEAELELLSGHPADLFAMAERLFEAGPIRHSNLSKSARARMFLDTGQAIEALAPRKAKPITLHRKQTAEEAARIALSECLDQFLSNIPLTAQSDNAKGPHQIRVGLRRLRSAISAFRPVLGRGKIAPVADHARDIAATVGRIRDLDVLAEEMVEPMVARHPDEPGFSILLASIDERRRFVREEVRAVLTGRDVTSFGFRTAGFLAGRGWLDPADHGQTVRLAEPVVKLARRRLNGRWKALSAYGRRAADLSIDERHEMRKEIKKLRYVGEIFQSLFDAQKVKAFRSALRKLQDDFGALNDVAMAEAHLLAPDGPGADDISAQRAAGRLIGAAEAEAARLWPVTIVDWEALERLGPFWR